MGDRKKEHGICRGYFQRAAQHKSSSDAGKNVAACYLSAASQALRKKDKQTELKIDFCLIF